MKRARKNGVRRVLLAVLAAAATLAAGMAVGGSVARAATGKWVAGDINTHTLLGDGSNAQGEVTRNAFALYGLNYLANSDPGGQSNTDPSGAPFVSPVWRWITLPLYSYPLIQDARETYAGHLVIQGLDWNAPGHEDASVGIIGGANEPNGISNFEYIFDKADTDTSRADEGLQVDSNGNPAVPFDKHNTTAADTLAGVQWLEDNYFEQSYVIVNNPSQELLWSAADLRAMNDAAPDVAFGMEGMPGHQAAAARGGYGYYIAADGTVTADPAQADATLTAKARTYGGADYMLAKVGGLWDSLLGEGRHFWIFDDSAYQWASKQYKDAGGNVIGTAYQDFWPGQYGKTWTFEKKNTNAGLLDGMRSGDVFVASGDLINKLDFEAAAGKAPATMGQTLKAKKGQKITVTIGFASPKVNDSGAKPQVDHVDLIAGDVTGMISPTLADGTTPNPAYDSDTNPSAHVVKTFTKKNWKMVHGLNVVTRHPEGLAEHVPPAARHQSGTRHRQRDGCAGQPTVRTSSRTWTFPSRATRPRPCTSTPRMSPWATSGSTPTRSSSASSRRAGSAASACRLPAETDGQQGAGPGPRRTRPRPLVRCRAPDANPHLLLILSSQCAATMTGLSAKR